MPVGIVALGGVSIFQLFAFKSNWNYWADVEEFKGFVVFLPVFILVGRYKLSMSGLSRLFAIYIYATAITAALGLLEYYLPSVALSLPGFSVRTEPLEAWELNASQNFVRAGYTFWGSPTVGHIMVFSIPLFWMKEVRNHIGGKWKVVSLWILIILGIFVTGNRANWVHLLLMGFIYITLYKPLTGGVGRFFKVIIGVMVVLVLAVQFLPESTLNRIMTIFFATQGEADIAKDSSGYVRQQRYDNALEMIKDNPLGVGWGGSGWVHADLLQITANLGWLGGLLFFAILLLPLLKAGMKAIHLPESSTYRKILVVFIAIQSVVILNFWRNGIFSLPQTGIYYFIFWSLLHHVLRTNSKKMTHGINTAAPNLQ